MSSVVIRARRSQIAETSRLVEGFDADYHFTLRQQHSLLALQPPVQYTSTSREHAPVLLVQVGEHEQWSEAMRHRFQWLNKEQNKLSVDADDLKRARAPPEMLPGLYEAATKCYMEEPLPAVLFIVLIRTHKSAADEKPADTGMCNTAQDSTQLRVQRDRISRPPKCWLQVDRKSPK